MNLIFVSIRVCTQPFSSFHSIGHKEENSFFQSKQVYHAQNKCIVGGSQLSPSLFLPFFRLIGDHATVKVIQITGSCTEKERKGAREQALFAISANKSTRENEMYHDSRGSAFGIGALLFNDTVQSWTVAVGLDCPRLSIIFQWHLVSQKKSCADHWERDREEY